MKRTYELIRVTFDEEEERKCPCCNWSNFVMFKLGEKGDLICPDCMINYLVENGFLVVKPKVALTI